MIERRKYPRFNLKVKAKYRVIGAEETYSIGKTRNLSAEGICFESDTQFRPGMHVRLEVDLEDRKSPVSMIGEIKWSSAEKGPGTGKKYLNGVKLVNVPKSDEGRFLKYYCDMMVEKLKKYLEM